MPVPPVGFQVTATVETVTVYALGFVMVIVIVSFGVVMFVAVMLPQPVTAVGPVVGVRVGVGSPVLIGEGVIVGAPGTYTTAIALLEVTTWVPSEAVALAELMMFPAFISVCVVA